MRTTNKQESGLDMSNHDEKIEKARNEVTKIFDRYGVSPITPLEELVEVLSAEDFEDLEFYSQILNYR